MGSSIIIDRAGRVPGDSALRDKADALNKEAAANWGDPQWMRLMASEVTETILEGFDHENLANLITTVENAPFDGRVLIKETRGLRAFWVARGGYIEASNLRSEIMELKRDTIGFHVYEHEDKLTTNFAETQGQLIDLGIERMDAEVNLRILRTMQAAIPSSSPYYIDGTSVSLTALDTAIDEVADETKLDPTQLVIVGRRTMIGQIISQLSGSGAYSGYLPETNEEILRTGVTGRYNGVRLAFIKNFKDDEDISFFPANEMFVVAPDASKFAFWGGLLAKEWTENDNWYWHYIARRDFGGVVHRPERLRRIVDTNLAP